MTLALPNPWIIADGETTEPARPAAPEPFSEYAARRSSPIVSPPLPAGPPRAFEPDFDALFAAIIAPVDNDPLPVFLQQPPSPIVERKARPALLRALFEISERD